MTTSQTSPASEGERRIQQWQAAYERVRALVAEADPEALEARVPACPGWTGRELLAHMVGLGADVVGGDEPDDHNEAWTQAQVDARADRSPGGAAGRVERDGAAARGVDARARDEARSTTWSSTSRT